MGAWGARIYEDDTALDVRGEFIEQFKAGKTIEEIEKYLTDETKKNALEVIDSGRDLKRWREESDPNEAGLRSHELTLIKKYIQTYDGQPVKRKSWTELQRHDKVWQSNDAPDQSEFELEKLDEIGWHIQDAKVSDEETQIVQAGAHIACFVYWLVTRDLYRPYDDDEDSATAIAMVKSGGLTPTQFLEDEMDEKLFVGNAKQEARDFLQTYYADGYHRYYYDFLEVLCSDRELYSFIPSNDEYETMARRIDERLQKFRKN
jgi:hypothetical protein